MRTSKSPSTYDALIDNETIGSDVSPITHTHPLGRYLTVIFAHDFVHVGLLSNMDLREMCMHLKNMCSYAHIKCFLSYIPSQCPGYREAKRHAMQCCSHLEQINEMMTEGSVVVESVVLM